MIHNSQYDLQDTIVFALLVKSLIVVFSATAIVPGWFQLEMMTSTRPSVAIDQL